MTILQRARYEAIVKEVKELFLERGIDEVTMVDIARHLSIGEASLYRYFGKKQKLMIEVGTLIWEEIYQGLNGLSLRSTGYENLESFYGFFLEIFKEHPRFFSFVAELDLKIVQLGVSKEELKEYEASILEFKKVFDGFFRMGKEDGTVKSMVDQEVFYYTTTHGIISLCKKLATQSQLLEYESEIEDRAQIECLITICLQYLKGRGLGDETSN